MRGRLGGLLLVAIVAAAGSCSGPTEPGPSPAVLHVLWSRSATWPYLGTPAVAESSAYLEITFRSLAKIGLADGVPSWEAPLPEPSGTGSPAIVGGTLYLATSNSNACALDRALGAVVWSTYVFPPDSTDCCGLHINYDLSNPVVDDGRMYFASSDGSVYCLNCATGQLEWRYVLGAPCVAKPLLAEGLLFLAGFDSTLTALDPATGIPSWRLALGEEVEYTAPQNRGRDIYVGGRGGSVFCVGAQDGQLRWKRSQLGRIRAGLSVTDAAVCVGTADYLYALDPRTGRVCWRRSVVGHNPVQEGGNVYFLSNSGDFFVCDVGTGRTIASCTLGPGTPWTTPVVLADRVLVPSYGVLYCVDKVSATANWPLQPPGSRGE